MTIWVKFQENWKGCLYHFLRIDTEQAMNIEPVSLFFQLCAYLRMKFGNVEAVGRIQIGKKSITQKDSFIYNIGRFGFRKEQTFAVITASAKALMGISLSKQ